MQEPNNTLASARSVHLSASAGSGKTRALKDRYLALLGLLDRLGLGLDQAVAITFTDKAAAEIRERVMKDLSEPLLRKIVRGRQDLRISTIHSFCMNLLKRYPLEAGLPPDFGVLDDRDRALTALRSIEDALETSDRDPGIMDPLREFTGDDLIGMIEYLLSIRSRLKRIEIDAGGPPALLLSVRSGMGSDHAERELNGLIAGGEWRAHFRRMEEILRPLGDPYESCKGGAHLQLAQANGVDAAALLAESLNPVYFTNEGTPRKNPWIPKKSYSAGNRREYEDAYAAVQGLLVRFRDLHALARAGREAISLLSLYFRAEERYQDAKLREGLLDFDDLEIYAYRLLKSAESPDILYWLDRKVLHYLVDEFQDTSDVQWAILSRLTEEIFAGEGADKPMPPTLFVVGDEKQSIYRFREANYRLIENVRRRMEENIPPARREIRALDRNFRSVPEVIGTVNRVFTRIWEGSYRASLTERSGHAGSARLIEIPPNAAEGPFTSPAEAQVMAKEIRSFIDKRTTIYEKALGSRVHGDDVSGWIQRAAGYGDCAILIQSRTRLKEYEAALLQEGIPYRVIGGIGFYEEDEVQAVMNTLFFLWNRDDRLSLAAALKSPLFGLTDNDIREVFSEGGDVLTLLRERHPEAGERLHAWRSLAGLEPLAGMVHRIINETGAYIRFGRRNPQSVFNLDKLIDTAREFDRRGHTTLQDFVGWVRNIRATEQREATADMYLPGFQGAVSIMTVHKAKGLEFPVVFLPGMNQQARSITNG
ncbi:MAG TPA: UvrD-helicase domain-containing protein, partial [Nitrospirota bacterium]|nr:UvrD-helicase domain-containing protein [Nitrospirota bacterium]